MNPVLNTDRCFLIDITDLCVDVMLLETNLIGICLVSFQTKHGILEASSAVYVD